MPFMKKSQSKTKCFIIHCKYSKCWRETELGAVSAVPMCGLVPQIIPLTSASILSGRAPGGGQCGLFVRQIPGPSCGRGANNC